MPYPIFHVLRIARFRPDVETLGKRFFGRGDNLPPMRATRLMWLLLLVVGIGATACSPAEWRGETGPPPVDAVADPAVDEIIEIEYWQYNFGEGVAAMDILIEQFHEQYPNIRVLHNYETPLEDFNEVMAARAPAGVGPDLVRLYYGWQATWIDAGYLVSLPRSYFPHSTVRNEFNPFIETSFLEGELYSLPTAVQVGALYYNKDLMVEAGLNPETPPTTLQELAQQAVLCTQRNEDGSFEVMGLPISINGQAEYWFREVLLRQFGQPPMSDDRRTILWNGSREGYAAWQELLRFQTEFNTGDSTLFDSDPNYFVTGRACFHIDTSARLEIIAANAPDLQFGVTELPYFNDTRHTFAGYWAHGITQKGASSPERLDAVATFLQYITRPEAGRLWSDIVGELPAQQTAIQEPAQLFDPLLAPFLVGLTYAHAPFIIDEEAERAALRQAYEAVVLDGADPDLELDRAVQTIQALFDAFWERR